MTASIESARWADRSRSGRDVAAGVLVVDWRGFACGVFSRLLTGFFARVYGACCIEDAELVLQTCRVTHVVICDSGSEALRELVVEAVRNWRKAYSRLSRVVLISQSDLSRTAVPSEVDYVLGLHTSAEEMLVALGGRRP